MGRICLDTCKSTTGGLIKTGNHIIKSWSTTQTVIALSSGEAEYYALVKAASQALGLKVLQLVTDASAAKGIAARRGLGQVRHIETNQLWLQQKVHNGEILEEKCNGNVNIADSMTKHVRGDN